MKPPLQLTLAILKPDVFAHPLKYQYVQTRILEAGFYVIKSAVFHPTLELVEQFYEEHREKFFYNRLITFLSSDTLSVHILARENAISYWRNMIGPTKVFKAIHEDPECIRSMVGVSDTRNSVHGSDSPETAKREINFFFPQFRYDDWFKTHEQKLRQAKTVNFDEDSWEHKL